ncbi:helix-turn-helix transcriptional regulator [Macrococcus capreoli]|uniref:XRE family transcriptional regulator XdrA n=1 Tax=Macrococcus capreoli TaxID=2982690 RepID=UPI0021D59E06|nr:helix-turn-helix domain-containing protein [Macrococcus sp. TMW 2.2395]MCU7557315.1 helix-turn-helix domain-containing protein [Macrococcus sp. TMW 2.2395]
MDKQQFTDLLQTKFKMVRIEAGYTQDTMAQTIGLSKKTLVQIEKERVLPNWTTCVSLCALFRDSEVLQNTLGGDPLEVIQVISRGACAYPDADNKNELWWTTIESDRDIVLQQNKISNLYRVLDGSTQPVYGSNKAREAEMFFNKKKSENLVTV